MMIDDVKQCINDIKMLTKEMRRKDWVDHIKNGSSSLSFENVIHDYYEEKYSQIFNEGFFKFFELNRVLVEAKQTYIIAVSRPAVMFSKIAELLLFHGGDEVKEVTESLIYNRLKYDPKIQRSFERYIHRTYPIQNPFSREATAIKMKQGYKFPTAFFSTFLVKEYGEIGKLSEHKIAEIMQIYIKDFVIKKGFYRSGYTSLRDDLVLFDHSDLSKAPLYRRVSLNENGRNYFSSLAEKKGIERNGKTYFERHSIPQMGSESFFKKVGIKKKLCIGNATFNPGRQIYFDVWI